MSTRIAPTSTVLAALAELVRAPAALTVPGDTLAGSAAAYRPMRGRRLALPAASVALYWAGMALNDYADRELDAVERPERPIPSGRIRPGQALAVAGGLTAAGLSLAAVGGGRDALLVAVPLAGAVWAYDLVLKPTPAGPLAMAACRGLDVLLGAGASGARRALPAAAVLAGYTASVTLLARGEVAGASRDAGAAAAGTTAAAAVAAAGLAARNGAPLASAAPNRPPSRLRDHVLTAVAAAGLVASTGRAQLAAARDPSAPTVRRATIAGIHGMVPLQVALAARPGFRLGALGVLAALPAARLLARMVSPT
ncbi:MAG TPA: UbiA family prenyltransferase [Pseudonocardiaceae bacterium]|nr:UbiA family prenyltransferase [Pseudonocardiaceae bacterium]